MKSTSQREDGLKKVSLLIICTHSLFESKPIISLCDRKSVLKGGENVYFAPLKTRKAEISLPFSHEKGQIRPSRPFREFPPARITFGRGRETRVFPGNRDRSMVLFMLIVFTTMK